MPLPNADKDKRLYELLKTQDLENLSYADFQGAAEKIFVEGINEDDLRRVVLIQLARMAVAGEWNGFTSSGGGGGTGDFGFGAVFNASNDTYVPGDAAPYGGTAQTASTVGTNAIMCYPWVAPTSGNISNFEVRVNSTSGGTNILQVAVFSDSGSGYPDSIIGAKADINCNSAAVLSASPGATVSVVKGTKYWMVYVWTSNYAAGNSPTMWIHTDGTGTGFNSSITQGAKLNMQTNSITQNVMPSTMPTSDYSVNFNKKIRFGINFA
ncbi:MAG: hypothetical protein GY865_15145 [candidate division Zixibacteria bacterium]|nr:hypothetical protein [candidate division Zixibacteria bacterium]|tara:strand:+ start:2453 stop:3253 length:801 start_codon:yes stop_codon:yes gene_type:complete